MIKFGSLNLKDIKLGDTQVKKVAVGSEVIWEKSGGLPSGYRQVEYLESTGTQWIDSLFYPNQDTRVVCECYWTYETVFGSRQSALSRAYAFLVGGGTRFRTDFNNKQGWFDGVSINQRIRIDKNRNETVIIDENENEYKIELDSATFSSPKPIAIFALNQNSGVAIGRGKIYSSFQIYDNDILARNFLTCLDPNDRPCMFDLVTQQPFYNQGTGEFLYGNII